MAFFIVAPAPTEVQFDRGQDSHLMVPLTSVHYTQVTNDNMLKSFFPVVTKKHIERKVLHTPPRHLFRIIQDVDAYSQFLPLCTYSKVLKQSLRGKHFDATLTVGLPPLFSETYTSHVRVEERENEWTVQSKSIESSLFDSLESRWVLRPSTPNDDGSLSCQVNFQVEMSVRDPIVAQTLDHVLQEVAGRQVAAFETRCDTIPIRDGDGGLPKQ